MASGDNANGSSECNAYFLAHSNAISNTQTRVEKIENIVQGMPQEVQSITETIKKLSDNMEKLLERLENKYVSKELYETHMNALIKDQADTKIEMLREIKALKGNQDYMFKGFIIMCLYVIRDLASKYLHL